MKNYLFLILGAFVWNTAQAQYCTSGATSDLFLDITGVTIGGFSNSSSCNSLTSLSGVIGTGTAGNYTNWTNSSLPVPDFHRGASKTINVAVNTCNSTIYGYSAKAFFDWNADGDFEDNLETHIICNNSTLSYFNLTLTVPMAASLGQTRMRIVTVEQTPAASISSCGTYLFGETEDYTINIANCNSTSLTISNSFNGSKGSSAEIIANSTDQTYTNVNWKKDNITIAGANSSSYIIPKVSYSNEGNYCATFVFTNGCDMPICSNLAIDNSVPSCDNHKDFQFTNTANNFQFSPVNTVASPYTATYTWKFNNNILSVLSNPTIQFTSYNNSATQVVSIWNTSNVLICKDSSSQSNIFMPNLSCTIEKNGNNLNAVAKDGFAPYTYAWSGINTGTSQKEITNPGTYNVSITDAFGGMTGCSYVINSTTLCSQYKSYTYSKSDKTCSFSSQAIPASYQPTYSWTFGDGQSSTISNPSHTYTDYGIYQVTMNYSLYDQNQTLICSDNYFETINLQKGNQPIACNTTPNFSYSMNTIPGFVGFYNTTNSSTEQMYTYEWSFGDGATSISKNTQHIFPYNGTFQVKLKVKRWLNSNNYICEPEVVKNVLIINATPCNRLRPSFNWHNTLTNYSFYNTTKMDKLRLESIEFKVGDDATYTTDNAMHIFITEGNKSVIMTITVYDSISKTICTNYVQKYLMQSTKVCGEFKANFMFTKADLNYSFRNLSIDYNSNTSYLYNFSNGYTSTLENPNYTFPSPGYYQVNLIATKTVGNKTCVDSIKKIVLVYGSDLCKDIVFQGNILNCYDYTDLVCGCDNITYKNSCISTKAGVKNYTYGPCPNDTNYLFIKGFAVIDNNYNCAKDPSDSFFKYASIKISTNNFTHILKTNEDGYYYKYYPKGQTYIVSQIQNNEFNNSITCGTNTPYAISSHENKFYNFYNTFSPCADMELTSMVSGPIVPGFVMKSTFNYKNRSDKTVTDVYLKYKTSAPFATNNGDNIFTFHLGNVPPLGTGSREVTFDIPWKFPIGSIVDDTAWIETIDEECTITNNKKNIRRICVGSYDPNDKTAFPTGNTDTAIKEISYLVRFQNTGTAPARNVVIEDVIDPNFDLTTLNIYKTSHKSEIYVDDNRKMYVKFPNIMLPDTGSDYEGSQGYVMYSLKLKNKLPIGTVLKNTAHIFFDFNDPIITNTTINTIVLKSTNGIQNMGTDMNISIFPNPTSDLVKVSLNLIKASKVNYKLYDLNGKLINQLDDAKLKYGIINQEVDLSQVSKGIYLLNISIDNKVTSVKIVKE